MTLVAGPGRTCKLEKCTRISQSRSVNLRSGVPARPRADRAGVRVARRLGPRSVHRQTTPHCTHTAKGGRTVFSRLHTQTSLIRADHSASLCVGPSSIHLHLRSRSSCVSEYGRCSIHQMRQHTHGRARTVCAAHIARTPCHLITSCCPARRPPSSSGPRSRAGWSGRRAARLRGSPPCPRPPCPGR